MTVRKVPGGKYNLSWRDTVAKGRARKRARQFKRDVMAVKLALGTLKLRYCQEASFWNPRYHGPRDDWDAGLQWVDFVVKGKRPFVIILDDPSKRWKAQEKIAYQVKLEGLTERGIPFLVVKKGMTSQEYYVKIMFFMRKLK